MKLFVRLAKIAGRAHLFGFPAKESAPKGFNRRRMRLNSHAVGDGRAACDQRMRFARNLHRAQPTAADRIKSCIEAKRGNVKTCALRRAQNCLLAAEFDILAVNRQPDHGVSFVLSICGCFWARYSASTRSLLVF